MKLFGWPLRAVSSLLLLLQSGALSAATRPQYGGTLRVAIRSAPATLDPSEGADENSPESRNLSRLMFDTLVTLSDSGKVQPALAVTWQEQSGGQRWQLSLRRGVKFDDGSPLTPDIVASSLRTANLGWNINSSDESVLIELPQPNPALLAELALERNSIVKRSSGTLHGTGPFHVTDWRAGQELSLVATEDYWDGRAYLDSIQIDVVNPRDQMLSLELGKANLVNILPEQARKAVMEGRRISTSPPLELMALVFSRDRQSVDDGKLRESLALAIDRISIKNVLLQGEGEPAGTILPRWLNGYDFLFSKEADLARARQQVSELRSRPSWTLGYDSGDPLARLVAERIVLNARDAGLNLQLAAGMSDVRLVRIILPSLDPWVSLMTVAKIAGLPAPKHAGDGPEDLYRAENQLLRTDRMIPLFHLPLNYGLSPAVRNWVQRQDGIWDLRNLWIASETR